MGKMSNIWLCGWLNVRKWSSNPRIYIIVILLGAFLFSILSNVRMFCAATGTSAAPWLFPFIMDHPFVLLIVMLGIVLLFCDAPFIDSHQPAVIVRMGKTTWALGQILYIMIGTALYFAVIFVLSVIIMMPYVGFSSDWGMVISTLAQTNAGAEYDINDWISHSLILDYTPLEALVWCFLLSWLIGVFLGLVHFVVNQVMGRGFGAAAAVILILMIFFAIDVVRSGELFGFDIGSFRASVTIHYFTPVSWAGLSYLDLTYTKPFPPREYALTVLIVLNLILSALSVLAVKKKSVEVLPPV